MKKTGLRNKKANELIKLSIVTPTLNAQKYLVETIESVISQKGSFDLEYLLVDGGSTDHTLDIIRDYTDRIEQGRYPIQCRTVKMKLITGHDNNMYDALEKGFSESTGQIQAWINADDVYLPGAFEIVYKVFKQFPSVHWIKGITDYIDEASELTRLGQCHLYYHRWIRKGLYGRKLYFIQQSSVFWRRWLWEDSGGFNINLKLAGDFDLWIKFAGKTHLYSLNNHLCLFRFRSGQLSEQKDIYSNEESQVKQINRRLDSKIDNYIRIASDKPDWIRALLFLGFFGIHKYYMIERRFNRLNDTFRIKRYCYFIVSRVRY
jgi:glycosyltransferase involved in cell wall biosynthesis